MKMNKIFGFAALATLLLASCSEEQTAFNIDSVPGKATVSGEIVYNAGTVLQDGNFVYNYQPAADIDVFVTVGNSGYKSDLEGNSVFITRTDENGHYSIEIPTGADGSVSATVRTADFEGVMKVVERKNNTIASVEKPVVRWGKITLNGIRNHGIYYGNIDCSYREPQVLPSSYTNLAKIEGIYMCNVETVEPFEAIRDEETNEIIGYRDAQLTYDWAGFGAADLIFEVTYDGIGTTVSYNCTTAADGKYSLNVPVEEFPAGFSVNIKAMPKNGKFTTYEEVYVTRELSDGTEIEVRSYTAHQLDGYYAMANAAGNNISYEFEMSGLVKKNDVAGMLFHAFENDQDTYDYSESHWYNW